MSILPLCSRLNDRGLIVGSLSDYLLMKAQRFAGRGLRRTGRFMQHRWLFGKTQVVGIKCANFVKRHSVWFEFALDAETHI